MLVVCAHPDRQLQPFIDRVPRLDAEVESIMGLRREKAAPVDLRGGSPITGDDFDAQLEEERAQVNRVQVKPLKMKRQKKMTLTCNNARNAAYTPRRCPLHAKV